MLLNRSDQKQPELSSAIGSQSDSRSGLRSGDLINKALWVYHHPFWSSGRAGGIDDVGGVLGGER